MFAVMTRGTMAETKKLGGRPRKYPEGTPLKRWIDKVHGGDYEAVAELIRVEVSTLEGYAAGYAEVSKKTAKKLKVLSGGVLTFDLLMDRDTFADFKI